MGVLNWLLSRVHTPRGTTQIGLFLGIGTSPGEHTMSENETHPNAEGASSNALQNITGTVKWFDPRKGFGFIVGPDGQDIFVHFTVIEGDGFRVLKDGSSVTYDAEHNDKGWRATKVHREQPEGEESDAPEVVVPRRTYSRTPRR